MSFHGTTILSVRKGKKVAIAADGQVSLGDTIFKSSAKKLRSIADGKIFAGFAGSTADALTLYERLEGKLEKYNYSLTRACVELAKDWRTDKYLRKLEAMMIVVDATNSFIVTGTGDVLEPEDGIAAIGSGGTYAKSAAKALLDVKEYDATKIAKKAMNIAADICVYSNHNIIIETINN
jgi:ATP-dependent HslUV protease, peptidase subunit HslV